MPEPTTHPGDPDLPEDEDPPLFVDSCPVDPDDNSGFREAMLDALEGT
jgi:hypothetical protein